MLCLDIGDADSAGNVTEGPVELDHVRNSYIRSDGPLTAVIGVEEVVVVADERRRPGRTSRQPPAP